MRKLCGCRQLVCIWPRAALYLYLADLSTIPLSKLSEMISDGVEQ
jgi:hypothetical protein